MTEPEHDPEEEQNEDDEFVAGWVFRLVPRAEVTRTGPEDNQPLIEAQWSDRPLHVVSDEAIDDWASSQAAAVRAHVTESGVELSIRAIDLDATLDEAKLTGEPSEKVLIVENSSGAQFGSGNRQLNIHHFTAKRVRICLDKNSQTVRGRVDDVSVDRATLEQIADDLARTMPPRATAVPPTPEPPTVLALDELRSPSYDHRTPETPSHETLPPIPSSDPAPRDLPPFGSPEPPDEPDVPRPGRGISGPRSFW